MSNTQKPAQDRGNDLRDVLQQAVIGLGYAGGNHTLDPKKAEADRVAAHKHSEVRAGWLQCQELLKALPTSDDVPYLPQTVVVASPDMYDALKAVEKYGFETWVLDGIRAAIARAEGRA